MSYKLEFRPTSNQSSREYFGASETPTGITIHWWGDPNDGATHTGVVSWLRGAAGGTSNRNSSAHYVVSAGWVTQLVEDTRAAWHAGNRTGNGETIGIEMHPRMSNGDWDTLVELCADLEERHGSMKYWRHMDWKATACPGVYATRISQLVNDVNAEHRRRNGGDATVPGGYRVKRTNRDNVPVMDGRGTSATQVDTLYTAGYRVNVVSEYRSWTQIRNSNGPSGNAWVASRYLNPFYEDQRDSDGVAPVDFLSRTNRPKVPVYDDFDTNAEEIGMMHNTGYRVRVVGMQGATGTWSQIRWDGATGWVETAHLERV
ncbi:MAG TPA: N-acetylmuramoyl-L-alanine amidase [Enteractinococcus sp.]